MWFLKMEAQLTLFYLQNWRFYVWSCYLIKEVIWLGRKYLNLFGQMKRLAENIYVNKSLCWGYGLISTLFNPIIKERDEKWWHLNHGSLTCDWVTKIFSQFDNCLIYAFKGIFQFWEVDESNAVKLV